MIDRLKGPFTNEIEHPPRELPGCVIRDGWTETVYCGPSLPEVCAKVNELVDAHNGPAADARADLLVLLVNDGPFHVSSSKAPLVGELEGDGLIKLNDSGLVAITDAGRRWLAGRR